MLVLLMGCTMGPSVETLVDELRVLAVVADPPEAGPAETIALRTVTVDPDNAGYDTLSWTCTFTGSDCAEALGEAAWSGISLVEQPTGPVESTYFVEPFTAVFLTEEPIPLVQSWTLSCQTGLCPPIEAVRDPDSADTETLRTWLSDPFTLLETLPLEGVSLGLRSLWLSTRTPEQRNQNPTVNCASEDKETTVGVLGERLYTCDVAGNFTSSSAVWGYTTAGGWEGSQIELDDGQDSIEYRWFAPEEPGEATLWIMVLDGMGGVGLWEESLTVQ